MIDGLICILGGSYIKQHNTIRRKNSANSAVTLVIISLQCVALLLKITVNRLNREAFIKMLLFYSTVTFCNQINRTFATEFSSFTCLDLYPRHAVVLLPCRTGCAADEHYSTFCT